jgi:histidinol-phosphate aminotransferase
LKVLDLIPDYIKDLPAYVPGRLMEDVAEEMNLTRIIKLASNENCLGPSPKAAAAMAEALTRLGRYGDADSRRFREALAGHLGLEPKYILAGNGSSEFILILAHALLKPGLSAVMSRPSFTLYSSNVRAAGAEAREVPVSAGFGHDLPAMLAKMDSETRLVFLDNPLNPTGAWLTPAEIYGFLEKLPPRCLLVLDEAYTDFARKERPDYDRLLAGGQTVILRTFSKIYGLAGARLAYMLADPDLTACLNKIRQPFNLNSPAQAGALAALSDLDHYQNTRLISWAGLDYFREKLPPLGLPVRPTQANFLMAGPVSIGGPALEKALLKEGIIIRSLASFGLERYVRITAGLPWENEVLTEALGRILRP